MASCHSSQPSSLSRGEGYRGAPRRRFHFLCGRVSAGQRVKVRPPSLSPVCPSLALGPVISRLPHPSIVHYRAIKRNRRRRKGRREGALGVAGWLTVSALFLMTWAPSKVTPWRSFCFFSSAFSRRDGILKCDTWRDVSEGNSYTVSHKKKLALSGKHGDF